MVDRNSRAAGAESSRSMVTAFVVRVDVPAGSIAHAHAPQSDRTAHSACTALIAVPKTHIPHQSDRAKQGINLAKFCDAALFLYTITNMSPSAIGMNQEGCSSTVQQLSRTAAAPAPSPQREQKHEQSPPISGLGIVP